MSGAVAETGMEREMRIREAQLRALPRRADQPMVVSAVPPEALPGRGSDTVALAIQTVQVINVRELLRAVNPQTKQPVINDEQLGQIAEQVELEMSRRGLRR